MAANAPVFRRDSYGDLYGTNQLPALEMLFRSELDQQPLVRDRIFKTVNTERDIWQYSELHDLGLFKEVPEGTEYSFERGKQGSSKTIQPKKFGLGFSISEEAIEDGRFDIVADHTRKLAKSALETQEVNAINILNNGFSSATTADGSSVFNTSHSLPSGGNYRNRLSTDADLSVTSLDTMLSDFKTEFVGDSGIPYEVMPKYLVVHPDNERLAKELIGSQLKPETADNNMNSFRDDGLEVIVSSRLTDANAWFLVASQEKMGNDHPLIIVQRTGIQTKASGPDAGFNNDSMLWKARYREELGAVHGYGIFGTSGAT